MLAWYWSIPKLPNREAPPYQPHQQGNTVGNRQAEIHGEQKAVLESLFDG
jgi:hypothetical protein